MYVICGVLPCDWLMQLQCHLSGEDPQSPEGSEAPEGHQQGQGPQGYYYYNTTAHDVHYDVHST